MVELIDIDERTFFERTVRIRQSWGQRRQRVISFAKSNRKPVVLRKFLLSYQLDFDCCAESIEGLLRNNVVEIALDYVRGKRRISPPHQSLAWIIHDLAGEKRKDALKG
jgi:hypothetical protein